MDLQYLMKENATYNAWANQRLVEWLKTIPEELLDKEVPSSFKSLKKTFLHIWQVEKSWLASLKGMEQIRDYGQAYQGSYEVFFEGILRQSRELAEYISSLDTRALQEDCNFKVPVRWPEWDDFNRPRFEVVQHCLNHSTYHRGQIVTIARGLGLTDIPMTDYMFYNIVAKNADVAV